MNDHEQESLRWASSTRADDTATLPVLTRLTRLSLVCREERVRRFEAPAESPAKRIRWAYHLGQSGSFLICSCR